MDLQELVYQLFCDFHIVSQNSLHRACLLVGEELSGKEKEEWDLACDFALYVDYSRRVERILSASAAVGLTSYTIGRDDKGCWDAVYEWKAKKRPRNVFSERIYQTLKEKYQEATKIEGGER